MDLIIDISTIPTNIWDFSVLLITHAVYLITPIVPILVLILAYKGLKNWRVDKTVEAYRVLIAEGKYLLKISRNEEDYEYKKNAYNNYINELESTLFLMNKGKLDKSLFKEIIKPRILGFIDNDTMKEHIYKMKEDDNKRGFPDTYRNLIKLIEEQEKKNVKK